MSGPLVIGIDMGSGGVRAAALDRDGRAVASNAVTMTTVTGSDGKSTHSAGELLHAVGQTVRTTSEQAMAAGRTVAALCLAGTAHALLLGGPEAPDDEVMLWSDSRSRAAQRDLVASGFFEGYSEVTGCPAHPAYWPAKITWLRGEGRLRPARPWVCSEKDLVFYRLTGQLLTDSSTAAATGLLDADQLDWSDELLDRLGASWIKRTQVRPSTHLEPLDVKGAAATGLPTGTPVVLGGVDGPLAQLGVGGTEEDVASLTIGTSLAVRRFSRCRPRDVSGRLWFYPLARDAWVIGGAGSNGGNVLTWLQRRLLPGSDDITAILERILERAPDPELVFIPYLNGERAPLWDDNLSGGLTGLRPHHDVWDLARAGFDSIGCLVHELGQVLRETTGPFTFAGLNGGFTGSQAWSQLAVDAIGVPGAAPLQDLAVIQGAAHLAWSALDCGTVSARRAETGPVILPDAAEGSRIADKAARLAAVRS